MRGGRRDLRLPSESTALLNGRDGVLYCYNLALGMLCRIKIYALRFVGIYMLAVVLARILYDLTSSDWQHLTSKNVPPET